MKGKFIAAVVLVVLTSVGVTFSILGRQQEAGAQTINSVGVEKMPPPRLVTTGSEPGRMALEKGGWEYKVVFSSPYAGQVVAKPLPVDGGIVAADAYTKQYNALAAEGWEYVGPIHALQQDKEVVGAFVLFKRPKN